MAQDEGFIEPPAWLAPPAAAAPPPPQAPDDDSPEPDVITLPPGIADSATHRLPPERLRTPPTKPEIVFFAGAPGAVAVPATPGPAAAPAPTAPDLSDATVHVSRPTRAWRLVFEGSPPVVVGNALFLGRNPTPTAGHLGSPVLAIGDGAKSVSKTHAMLEVDAGELWVHDLHSTNGVWIVPAGGDAIEVTPGERVSIPAGSDLELGDFVIQIEHG